jgi:uncharacterized membrane protein
MRDKKRRSITKAISWRVIAVLITFIVSFIITKKIIIATTIGLLDSIIKIFGYYFHERVWENIRYGKF